LKQLQLWHSQLDIVDADLSHHVIVLVYRLVEYMSASFKVSLLVARCCAFSALTLLVGW